MGKFIDMTGWHMSEHGVPESRLTILYREPTKTHAVYWHCKCDCGKELVIRGADIRNGHTKSCGCLNLDKISERTRIDMTGQRYGRLTVIQYDHTDKEVAYWKCQCDCGNTTVVRGYSLRQGHVRSCGCLKSAEEAVIGKLLNDKHIDFKKEITFDDLLSEKGNKLRYDYGIYQNNELTCIIEYQGEQHSLDRSLYHADYTELHDQLKRDYCAAHHIPLYYIDYNEDVETRLNEIIEELGS